MFMTRLEFVQETNSHLEMGDQQIPLGQITLRLRLDN